MIVQAMSHNLASSSPTVRTQSEQLLALLEDTTESPAQLVQLLRAERLGLCGRRSDAGRPTLCVGDAAAGSGRGSQQSLAGSGQ